VALGHLDLASLDSVRDFAATFQTAHGQLDVLINNAGVIAGTRRETVDGHEWTLAVNHLGPFLLTNLLTDILVAGAPARVITVSSENHRRVENGLDFEDLQMTGGYGASKAYAASKLANILFTVELRRRLHDAGIVAAALHPGVVATSIGRGPEGPRWMGLLTTLLKPVLRKPSEGAATSVFLATTEPATVDTAIYWSDQKPRDPIPAATDPSATRRLWSTSEALVGLPA
jgi:NAD(P)-dependent dehydrogenase (short-subunit alcohol dehydrogenase family)